MYILNNHHYCDFLRQWSSYAVPLNISSKFIGYLALFSLGESISKELIAITDLLGYKIINEMKNNQYQAQNNSKITNKQKTVLQLLAAGQTEKAVAIEMGLNVGTIKYHKLNAFKKLDANCTIEAVIKAIKSNQMSLDDIDV